MKLTKADVINMFYNQNKVKYSVGFKLFEDTYEELKDELDLIREVNGDIVIVRPRKTKVELIKEILEENRNGE